MLEGYVDAGDAQSFEFYRSVSFQFGKNTEKCYIRAWKSSIYYKAIFLIFLNKVSFDITGCNRQFFFFYIQPLLQCISAQNMASLKKISNYISNGPRAEVSVK